MVDLSTHCLTVNPSRTILMAETDVLFEDPRLKIVNVIGARHLTLKSTVYAAIQVTVVLAVTAFGKKLFPVVVWKE